MITLVVRIRSLIVWLEDTSTIALPPAERNTFVYKYDGEPTVRRRCQHIRKEQTEGCHMTPFDSGSAVICECDGNGCNSGSHLQVSLSPSCQLQCLFTSDVR